MTAFKVEISGEAVEAIDKMAAEQDRTRFAIIRRALALYDMVIEAHRQGAKVIIRHAGQSDYEVKLP